MMKIEGADEPVVLEELKKFWEKDNHFSSGRVLSPMMSSSNNLVLEAQRMFSEANLGNPGLYPGTLEMEKKVMEWIGSLVSAPANTLGNITSGGTESNITALWMARNKTGNRRVLFSRNAHFSLTKACDLLCMEPVEIPVDGEMMPDMDVLRRELEQGAACVIGIAGTTEFGVVEPIQQMSDMAPEIPFHVDAAFGGFVLPFMDPVDDTRYDFSIPGVSSISIDPHKMGGAAIPSGALLFRPEAECDISVSSPYLTVEKHTGLLGTRFSAAVAGTYAAMRLQGVEGYRKRVSECMENTRFLTACCEEKGIKTILEPKLNMAVLEVFEPKKVKKELAKRGWYVSCTREPEGLRVVVMPHVTQCVVESFVKTLLSVL